MNTAQERINQRRAKIIKEALRQSKNTQYGPEQIIAQAIIAKLREQIR